MRVNQIGQINEALLVLKHFIELSSRLLPFLDELQRKKNPSTLEQINRRRIMDVFENYNFTTDTSRILLNSDILEMIKESFNEISQDQNRRSSNKSRRALRKFQKEHKRLQEDWFQIDAN